MNFNINYTYCYCVYVVSPYNCPWQRFERLNCTGDQYSCVCVSGGGEGGGGGLRVYLFFLFGLNTKV